MIRAYAILIRYKRKTLADVPEDLREAVAAYLAEQGW